MLGIGSLAKRLFGSANDRIVKGYAARVLAINAIEPQIKALSDQQHTMEAVIVTRFLGATDFILKSEDHYLRIRNFQRIHATSQPHLT